MALNDSRKEPIICDFCVAEARFCYMIEFIQRSEPTRSTSPNTSGDEIKETDGFCRIYQQVSLIDPKPLTRSVGQHNEALERLHFSYFFLRLSG